MNLMLLWPVELFDHYRLVDIVFGMSRLQLRRFKIAPWSFMRQLQLQRS